MRPRLDKRRDVRLGDDCAAIPDGDRYLLLAAEGMLPSFVADDPWFAGYSAVMVNISDVAAMGGHAIAVVDILWSGAGETSEAIWDWDERRVRGLRRPDRGRAYYTPEIPHTSPRP